MSLDKSIKSGKEHRKQYRGSKNFSYSCRNHKSCKVCEGNRTYQSNKAKEEANTKMEEYKEGNQHIFNILDEFGDDILMNFVDLINKFNKIEKFSSQQMKSLIKQYLNLQI